MLVYTNYYMHNIYIKNKKVVPTVTLIILCLQSDLISKPKRFNQQIQDLYGRFDRNYG